MHCFWRHKDGYQSYFLGNTTIRFTLSWLYSQCSATILHISTHLRASHLAIYSWLHVSPVSHTAYNFDLVGHWAPWLKCKGGSVFVGTTAVIIIDKKVGTKKVTKLMCSPIFSFSPSYRKLMYQAMLMVNADVIYNLSLRGHHMHILSTDYRVIIPANPCILSPGSL